MHILSLYVYMNVIVSSRICLIGGIWNKGVFIFRALWENGCRGDSGDWPVHILPISSTHNILTRSILSLLHNPHNTCTPPLPARVRLYHKDVPQWECKRYLCVRCRLSCVCEWERVRALWGRCSILRQLKTSLVQWVTHIYFFLSLFPQRPLPAPLNTAA